MIRQDKVVTRTLRRETEGQRVSQTDVMMKEETGEICSLRWTSPTIAMLKVEG